MANRADIVIGANFGDEGKGLVTDFLASRAGEDTLVVRHNGGAQAGHTVTTPDGRRHVFKHFGSGSFTGAKTYLSRFYACNPLLYFKELEALQALGIDPEVYADPLAPVSTPYDMMINQMIEEHRGQGRHGSCGVGFGETVERNAYPEYMLSFHDLRNKVFLRGQLEKIRSEWLPHRLRALGIDDISPSWRNRIYSGRIFDWYVEQAQDFCDAVKPAAVDILQKSRAVIFEGAQGLLLDQQGGWFPHVTRSRTGIHNALALAKEAGIKDIRATYITRAYNTRHGAGPFPHEVQGKPYAAIEDRTNIYNEYQGGLRFGHLDLDLLAATIRADMRHARGMWGFTHRLAVTCLDQVDPQMSYVVDGKHVLASRVQFLVAAKEAVGGGDMLISRGPTRRDVRTESDRRAQNVLLQAFHGEVGRSVERI